MNSVILTICVLAALAMLPASEVRGVLATAAGSLFEGTPFILAGIALQWLLVRRRGSNRAATAAMALLGCGCGTASARSLPAAAAAAMAFGWPAAVMRFIAGLVSAAIVGRCRVCHPESHEPHTLLAQLATLLPAALASGAVMHVLANARLENVPAAVQWLAGALAGFAAMPCALGAVSIAASLHARAPLAACGMLCTSGIFDLASLQRGHRERATHDALAYAFAAAALAIVAVRGGDALVHPRLVVPLGLCSIACCTFAVVHRTARSARARFAPAIMLAGALIAAPPPLYGATETTLGDLFPGERLDFTGQLVHGKGADAVVRFAITCCRADATPVAVALERRTQGVPAGSWVRVVGTVVRDRDAFGLDAGSVQRVAPPSDPFVYR